MKRTLLIIALIMCFFLIGCGSQDYAGEYGGISDDGIFVSMVLNDDGTVNTNILGIPLEGKYEISHGNISIELSTYGISNTLQGKLENEDLVFGDIVLKKGTTLADVVDEYQADIEDERFEENPNEPANSDDEAWEEIPINEDSPDSTEEFKEVNPFEGLEVQFDGISPYLTASLNTNKIDKEIADYVIFNIENSDEEFFAIGDEVNIIAEYDEDFLKTKGLMIMEDRDKITVPDKDKYLDNLNGTDLSRLNESMNDYIEAQCSSAIGDLSPLIPLAQSENFGPKISSIDSIEPIKRYFAVIKPQYDSLDEKHNLYATLYKVDFTFQHGDWYGKGGFDQQVAYTLIFADNIIVRADGSITWAGENDSTSEYLYGNGQALAYDQLVSKHIVGLKDRYNVEEVELNE